MTIKILFLLSISAFFASCASSGKAGDNSSQQYLIFGNGGGFTGVYTNYKLDDDGRVYSLHTDSSRQKINRIRKKQTRSLFNQADQLKIAQPVFSHPGNITWFIKYYAGGVLVEYKWGDSNVPVPVEIKSLYDQLITTVN